VSLSALRPVAWHATTSREPSKQRSAYAPVWESVAPIRIGGCASVTGAPAHTSAARSATATTFPARLTGPGSTAASESATCRPPAPPARRSPSCSPALEPHPPVGGLDTVLVHLEAECGVDVQRQDGIPHLPAIEGASTSDRFQEHLTRAASVGRVRPPTRATRQARGLTDRSSGLRQRRPGKRAKSASVEWSSH